MTKLTEIAQTVDATMGTVEAILVAVFGRVASWVAPIPVAVVVARSVKVVFELPIWVAAVVAAALELVGLSISQLWLTEKEYQAKKNKSDPSANLRLLTALVILYFVTDMLLIGFIEVPKALIAGDYSGLIALLFPLVALAGTLVLNERVEHRKRVAQVAEDKRKAAEERTRKRKEKGQIAQAIAQPAQALAQQLTKAQRQAQLLDIWRQDGGKTQTELAQVFGVSRQTISSDFADLAQLGKVRRNGRGVEVLEAAPETAQNEAQ